MSTRRTKKRAEGYRQTMHLALDEVDLENLDKIVAHMKRDPVIGRLKADLGREKAARVAIAEYARLTTG